MICKNVGKFACKQCASKSKNPLELGTPPLANGRRAIRKAHGYLRDGWMCNECIKLPPCKYCKNITCNEHCRQG